MQVWIIAVITVVSIHTSLCWGLAESMGEGGCNVEQIHDAGFNGEGINLGLISLEHPRCTHEAFGDPNRVFWYSYTGAGYDPNYHDTWVAGVVASEGDSTHPDSVGVAPKSRVHAAAVASRYDIRDALKELIENQNCRVMYSGIAIDGEPNDGESFYTLLCDYYANTYNCFFANPAGNSYNVNIFGDAYNGVTVGGLILEDPNTEVPFTKTGSKSGSGPTEDERRKPEVTAPSQNQTVPHSSSDTSWHTWSKDIGATSFSAPYAAGVAALLIEYADGCGYTDANNTEVVKAVIVNSAFGNIKDKSGNYTYPASNTWQKDRGYGRVDGLAAFQTLQAGKIIPDANTTQPKGWAYNILAQGQQNTYKIYVDKNHRLKITLTWNRRIEWDDDDHPRDEGYGKIDPDELTGYLADLDLVVTDPCGQQIFSEQNPDDNLEKCDVLVDKQGFYTIEVVNDSDNDESADYGLAFEVYPPLDGDYPPVDYKVDYLDLKFLTDGWAGAYDFTDFTDVCENWLKTDEAYYPATAP